MSREASELKTVLDILTVENVRMICTRVRVEQYMYDPDHFESRYAFGVDSLAKIDEHMKAINADFLKTCQLMDGFNTLDDLD